MANFFYNGVKLPSINTVWTDKEKYPYAMIWDDTGDIVLYCSTSPWWLDKDDYNLCKSIAIENGDTISYMVYEFDGSAWGGGSGRDNTDDEFLVPLDLLIWSSHDIYDSTNGGTLCFPTSDPVFDGATPPTPVSLYLRKNRAWQKQDEYKRVGGQWVMQSSEGYKIEEGQWVKIVEPPTLAPNSTWYQGSKSKGTIKVINIVNSYTPTGNETESWAADVDRTGSIICYLTDNVLTIAGNGSGKIMANQDSSNLIFQFGMLTVINGLDLLDTSNATTMMYAFYDLYDLETLDVSKFNTSKVTDMHAMFHECGVSSIDVSNFDTRNVTRLSDFVSNCSKLTSIDVSGFDTSNVVNIEEMFRNCSKLTSIDVSGFDTSKVVDMNRMFVGCSALTSVDVSNFDTSNVEDMSYMFSYCNAITTLDLSGFDTSKATDMSCMFNKCQSLTAIYVGDGWTTKSANTAGMFNECGVSNVTYV